MHTAHHSRRPSDALFLFDPSHSAHTTHSLRSPPPAPAKGQQHPLHHPSSHRATPRPLVFHDPAPPPYLRLREVGEGGGQQPHHVRAHEGGVVGEGCGAARLRGHVPQRLRDDVGVQDGEQVVQDARLALEARLVERVWEGGGKGRELCWYEPPSGRGRRQVLRVVRVHVAEAAGMGQRETLSRCR